METVTITKEMLIDAGLIDNDCRVCGQSETDVLHGPPEPGCENPEPHHVFESVLEMYWGRLVRASTNP